MAVSTFTASGAKASTPAKLNKDVFAVEVTNHELVKQAYETYLANGRDNLAVVKTRGLVRGGGKKPWKQKGTGRARFGSTRNPIWRGGGIVFGPTGNENYTKKLSTTSKRVAIRQALSLAAEADKIVVIESFDCKDGKTAKAADLLKKIGADRQTLVVVEEKTDMIKQATNNLGEVKVVQSSYVNVFDVMNARKIVITKEALKQIDAWLGVSGGAAKEEK